MKTFLVGMAAALISTSTLAAHEGWMVTMSPSQEIHVPTVTGTNASCFATFVQTTPNRVRYRMGCLGLTDITAAHIHGPADADSNGPVIVTLYNSDTDEPLTGTFVNVLVREDVGSATFDAALQVLGGDQGYVNVHTVADPDGAVRGQIIPVSIPNAPYVPF